MASSFTKRCRKMTSLPLAYIKAFRAEVARKRESEAMCLVNHQTSFTELTLFISRMALHFAGLASIPLQVSMKPSNLLDSMVKAHFWGVQPHVVALEALKHFLQIRNQAFFGDSLYQHVIDVNFHRIPNVFSENFVHESLVRCSCVLQPERHYCIMVIAYGGDEGCLFGITWVHGYQLYPKYAS